MKPVLILLRIIFVGLFWSIFFLEGIRVIMLQNWYFDIFNTEHWSIAWNLWLNGWVIDEPKEWAFVLIILTFIPLWLTGWAALSLISWEKALVKLVLFPVNLFKKFFLKPVKIIKNSSMRGIKKRKSYKEIRPRSIRTPLDENAYNDTPAPQKSGGGKGPAPRSSAPAPAPKPLPQSPSLIEKSAPVSGTASFDHSLFKFDEEDDFEFNIDAFDEKPAAAENKVQPKDNKKRDNRDNKDNRDNRDNNRKNNKPNNENKGNRRDNNQQQDNRDDNRQPQKKNGPQPPAVIDQQSKAPRVAGSTLDVIKQKGYEVITSTTIKENLIDFIGISEKQIVLCLIDKEAGDWLADEERFNDEEPLWFSESSHRVSPVRKVDLARQALTQKLEDSDFNFEVKAYVIIQIGNIINAEDMFEVWDNMNISVTRIDRGSPKELKLFSKSLEDADSSIGKDEFEKLKKFIRNAA